MKFEMHHQSSESEYCFCYRPIVL